MYERGMNILALAFVRTTVRLLPSEVRSRYAEEFAAELMDIRLPGMQLLYATQLLLASLALRRVLVRKPVVRNSVVRQDQSEAAWKPYLRPAGPN